MILKELSLVNFKNYEQAELAFSDQVNCFVGDNGEGKTNLLDAVHYLSFCKSFFNPVDSQNILDEQSFFVVEGTFRGEEREDVLHCSMERNKKKRFRRNKKEYERFADHIGHYPVVMISPYDQELIAGGSDRRRRFIDSIIAQYDREYLDDLMAYNRALSQRNALLKQFAEKKQFSRESLEIWDVQLAETGTRIHEKRKTFVEAFVPVFNELFRSITGNKEQVALDYRSPLNDEHSLNGLLEQCLEKDRLLKYTTAGTHKDDLELTLEGRPIKKFGSQGQQKSYLLALKLAQFRHVAGIKGEKPVLLLDDVFDKLDQDRVERLMRLVSDNIFGQIFLTDTDPGRLARVFEGIEADIRTFTVRKGTAEIWEEAATTDR